MTGTEIRNTKDLRSFLVSQMNAAASGDFDATRAKAVANLAQQVYNTLNIELRSAIVRKDIGDTEIKAISFDE